MVIINTISVKRFLCSPKVEKMVKNNAFWKMQLQHGIYPLIKPMKDIQTFHFTYKKCSCLCLKRVKLNPKWYVKKLTRKKPYWSTFLLQKLYRYLFWTVSISSDILLWIWDPVQPSVPVQTKVSCLQRGKEVDWIHKVCLPHHSDAAPSAFYPLNQFCCFVLFKLRKDVSDLCFSCMPLASQNHMLLGLLSHYQITSFSHPYCATFLVQKYFMCIKS